MTPITQAEQDYFLLARERYRILLRRQIGLKRPWTHDPILQSYRFCNVFREDDVVTRWFKEKVRDPMILDLRLPFATTCFRFFNTIRTGEALLHYDLFKNWRPHVARAHLSDLHPLITAAYMVKTPLHKPKLEGLIEILDPVWAERESLGGAIAVSESLEESHKLLMKYPWIGPFMAYEIVTDLRHTPFLSGAKDILTWANPGPGATRGLQRIYGPGMNEEEKLAAMRRLNSLSWNPTLWDPDWPAWEMREVEHVLCEHDKYQRALLGEGRPKQKYSGKGE